jgi:hypothetical protein
MTANSCQSFLGKNMVQINLMSKYRLRDFLPLIIGLVGIFVVVLIIPQAVQYFGRAGGILSNIKIDVDGVLGPMPHPWRNLAQGGEESDSMLGGVTSEVKELRPEYIRLDHIYDAYEVVSRSGENLVFNWTKLDIAVEEILATGAKPMLALSYMPPTISKGDVIDLPNDWNEWGQVVQKTIEHYSGKNNKNITEVIYEVWNEPDLFGGYRVYGEKNYLTMYESSAKAANRATNVNPFEFGGPATTGLYKNWLQTLMKFAANNNLRLDFISWHKYSTDISEFENDIVQARTWAEEVPAFADVKFYVTEWGHNSENDTGYDDAFGAIHTLAGSRIMMNGISRAFVFEIKDGPSNEKFWGRWGLLTHEKFGTPVKKPRYNALVFLNRLEKMRVSLSGEGSWVKGIASKSIDGKVLRVLIVNYDPEGKHSEGVPITFENLPTGNFNYVRENFLGSSSKQAVATSEATWKTVELLPANSAAMLTLTF